MEQPPNNSSKPELESDVPEYLQKAALDRLTPSELVQPIGGHWPLIAVTPSEATKDRRVIATIRLQTGTERIGTTFQRPVYYTRDLTVWDTCWEAFGKRRGYLARQDAKEFYSELPIVKEYNSHVLEKERGGYFMRVQELFDYSIEEHRQLIALTCNTIIRWLETRSIWFKRKVLSNENSLLRLAQELKESASDAQTFNGMCDQKKVINLIAELSYLADSDIGSTEERSMARWLEKVLHGTNWSCITVVKQRYAATLPQYITDIIDRYMRLKTSRPSDNTDIEFAYLQLPSVTDEYQQYYEQPILAALGGEDPRRFFTHDAFLMTPEEYVSKRANITQVRATRAHLEAYLSSVTPSTGTVKRPSSPYR